MAPGPGCGYGQGLAMVAQGLPHDIRQFLREKVRTFEELETLRLLHSERDERWNSDAVGAKLNIPPSMAEEALDQLHRRGLFEVRVEGGITGYLYAVAEPALDALVTRSVQAYAHDRIGVMKLMSSNAVDRVRGSVLRTFADAFLLGGKKDG